jgi:hypothetical protein
MARFAGRVYDDPMLFALLKVFSRERDGLMSSQSTCKQQGSSSRSRFPLSGSPSKRVCLFRGQPFPSRTPSFFTPFTRRISVAKAARALVSCARLPLHDQWPPCRRPMIEVLRQP